jgi:hypothetical protein
LTYPQAISHDSHGLEKIEARITVSVLMKRFFGHSPLQGKEESALPAMLG